MRAGADDAHRLVLEFEDNRLLTLLFGDFDRHLAHIEQKLDLSITPRGNRLSIEGKRWAAEAAQAALKDLYKRLNQGLEIEIGDVDGAIRIAEAALQQPKPPAQNGGGANKQVAAYHELSIRTQKRLIKPRSATQAHYIERLRQHELVFGLGPAGTGKTYLAVAVAVEMLLRRRVDRIIMTRPAVEAGERLGFLPGTMDEKVDPYMRPMYDALMDMVPGDRLARHRDDGDIEVAPLAYMRGRTLSNAFIILDEAQNTTPMQMKMFLTRMGENSIMVVTGDPSQIDLPSGTKSGLIDVLELLDKVAGATVVRFKPQDVVRHAIVTQLVEAYAARDQRTSDTEA